MPPVPVPPAQETDSGRRKAAKRRTPGVVPTPEWLVDEMVQALSDQWSASWRGAESPLVNDSRAEPPDSAATVRVLDLGCGDGAFLLGWLRRLVTQRTSWSPVEGHAESSGDENRLDIDPARSATTKGLTAAPIAPGSVGRDAAEFSLPVVWELVGIDVDPLAVATASKRIAEFLGATRQNVNSTLPSPTSATLSERLSFPAADDNFATRLSRVELYLGDALRGDPAGGMVPRYQLVADAKSAAEIAGRSGAGAASGLAAPFDLVISNPPYIRERGSRELFDRIRAMPLGEAWSEPRMDYWHYFLHSAIDVLRPGGLLCFVVNSYFQRAASAAKLRRRLCDELQLRVWWDFGAKPIFPGVSGRHVVFVAQKRVTTAGSHSTSGADAGLAWPFANGSWGHVDEQISDEQPSRVAVAAAAAAAAADLRSRLGQRFDVRQGLVENPPRLTRKHVEQLEAEKTEGGPWRVGAGVFVLTVEEVAALQLSDRERCLLKPFYALSAIDRFAISAGPTHQLLYLTPTTAPDLDRFPKVAAHLTRFRTVLERRREVQSGRLAWWQLHWPRTAGLFEQQRILCPQLVRRPACVFAEQPAYVGFSVNVIRCRQQPAKVSVRDQPHGDDWSLPALAAMLNSSLAAEWFKENAKQRGVGLDLSGAVLRAFPLPEFDRELDQQLTTITLRRQQTTTTNAASGQGFAGVLIREQVADAALDQLLEGQAAVWSGAPETGRGTAIEPEASGEKGM